MLQTLKFYWQYKRYLLVFISFFVVISVTYSITFGINSYEVSEFPIREVSDYEKLQGSKLHDPRWFDRIKRIDTNIQQQLHKRFKRVFKENHYKIQGKNVLCIGARLGGEVRAFQGLGALSVGIDLMPGEYNKHVLYGSASDLQFASNVFDVIYSNILDHILEIKKFYSETCRTTREGAFLLLDLDQNRPDKWSVRDLRGKMDQYSSQLENKCWTLISKNIINNEKDKGKFALIFTKK